VLARADEDLDSRSDCDKSLSLVVCSGGTDHFEVVFTDLHATPIGIEADCSRTPLVVRVWPDSPADAMGVQAGDLILNVNGQDAASMGRWEFLHIFSSRPLYIRLARKKSPTLTPCEMVINEDSMDSFKGVVRGWLGDIEKEPSILNPMTFEWNPYVVALRRHRANLDLPWRDSNAPSKARDLACRELEGWSDEDPEWALGDVAVEEVYQRPAAGLMVCLGQPCDAGSEAGRLTLSSRMPATSRSDHPSTCRTVEAYSAFSGIPSIASEVGPRTHGLARRGGRAAHGTTWDEC